MNAREAWEATQARRKAVERVRKIAIQLKDTSRRLALVPVLRGCREVAERDIAASLALIGEALEALCEK